MPCFDRFLPNEGMGTGVEAVGRDMEIPRREGKRWGRQAASRGQTLRARLPPAQAVSVILAQGRSPLAARRRADGRRMR